MSLKCTVCARGITSQTPVTTDDETRLQLLFPLFKLLKISPAVCRFVLKYSSQPVGYCEPCRDTISNGLRISKEIEILRNSLEAITSRVKDDFLEGYYCRARDANEKFSIRKALVQCWSSCRVNINSIAPENIDTYLGTHWNTKIDLKLDSQLMPVKITESQHSSHNLRVHPLASAGFKTEETDHVSDIDFDPNEDSAPRSSSPIVSEVSDHLDDRVESDGNVSESESASVPPAVRPYPVLKKSKAKEKTPMKIKKEVAPLTDFQAIKSMLDSDEIPIENSDWMFEFKPFDWDDNFVPTEDDDPLLPSSVDPAADATQADRKRPGSDSQPRNQKKLKKSHKTFSGNSFSQPKRQYPKKVPKILQISPAQRSLKFPYHCKTCGKGYYKLSSLEIHEKYHQEGHEEFPCDLCEKSFLSVYQLHVHLSGVHSEEWQRRQKDEVDSNNSEEVSNPQPKRQKPKKLLKISPALTFDVSSVAFSHRCAICEKTYDVKYGIDKKTVLCPMDGCTKETNLSSKSRRAFQRHHDTHHAPRSFNCQPCGKVFSEMENSYFLNYSMERKYRCQFEGCQSKYKNFDEFRKHHLAHHSDRGVVPREPFNPETHLCKYCGKSFSIKKDARCHEISKHTKDFQYYCEICGVGRPSMTKLNIHRKTHSTERPFKCERCPKTFKVLFLLQEHMNLHNNVRPYICEICGRSYHNYNCLSGHLRTSHHKGGQL